MKGRYEFIPGSVASLLYVRPPGLTGESIACVFMSAERGVVVGRRDTPLATYGWPIKVQAQINKHFGTVFALEHENWKGRPRRPGLPTATRRAHGPSMLKLSRRGDARVHRFLPIV